MTLGDFLKLFDMLAVKHTVRMHHDHGEYCGVKVWTVS
jgi:hypothetical protein